MKPLGLFLGKFADLKLVHSNTKEALLGAVKKATGLDLPGEAVVIKRQGIYLAAPPVMKSLIFTRREAIVDEFLSQTGAKRAPKII